jgi:tetratricopeptide (TPR) repeat protein
VPAWHLDGAPDVPVADMVTESEDALREYSLAMKSIVFDEDWSAARDHLNAATAADSTMALAHFHRFLAYRLTNDYDQALGALQDALRHAYKVPERFRFIIKGNYYFLRQEPDKALALFEMMAELYPDDIQSFQALAQIYTYRNEVGKAITAYERVLELDPFQYDHLHRLASLYARRGDYERALTYVERYAEANPQDPRSFEEIAELNQRMGDFEAARENMDKALLLDPERVTLLIGAGNIDRATAKFDEALAHYREGLRLARSSTDSMRVLNALEDYYELRGQFAKSIELMNRRLAMNTTPLVRYSQRLGDVGRYVHAGRADEAYQIIDETMSTFDSPPMSYVVSYGKLEIYRALEQPDSMESAVKGFERYIEAFGIEVLRPEADLARARALELRGDYDGAVSVYEKVLAEQPSSATAHRALGRCYRELGQHDDAGSELQRSLALYPSSPRTHYELALHYHVAGDHERAREHLDQALAVWENADPAYREAARARELAAEWGMAASM